MNATERLNLQEAKAKAQQAQLLVTQARMQARGAAVTGPIGAIKGAALVSAAGGIGTAYNSLSTQLTGITAQKALMAEMEQLKTQPQTPAVREQVLSKHAQIQEQKKTVLAAREIARTTLPDILKILRQVNF